MMRLNGWTVIAAMACTEPRPLCADENSALVSTGECWPIKNSDSSPKVESKDTGEDTEDALFTGGLDKVKTVFPTAVGMVRLPIPDERNDPADVELGNTELRRVVDAEGNSLGFIRPIFTPVYCAADVCEAVLFDMAFELGGAQRAVYHPGGIQFLLMKYIDGTYAPFEDADMELLNRLFVEPPAAYAPVETVEGLVDGAHGSAPTLPEYQDLTVRGAVFTIWYILNYGQTTRELIEAGVFTTEEQPQ